MTKKATFGLAKAASLPKEPKKSNAFTQAFKIIKRLEFLIKQKHKTVFSEKTIKAWTWELVQYIKVNQTTITQLEKVLFYIECYSNETYFPKVRNGREFIAKIKNIESFIAGIEAKAANKPDPKKLKYLISEGGFLQRSVEENMDLLESIVVFYDSVKNQLKEIKNEPTPQGRAATRILEQLNFGYYVQTLNEQWATSSSYKWILKRYLNEINLGQEFDTIQPAVSALKGLNIK